MPTPRPLRADIWREGDYVDLWSVPHFLAGVAVGFALYIVGASPPLAFVISLTLFIVFKLIEMLLEVPETRMNRFIDIVASVVGFEMAYFFAPGFRYEELHILFGVVAIETLALVLIGLKASRQAVEQEDMLIDEVRTRRNWLERQRRSLGAAGATMTPGSRKYRPGAFLLYLIRTPAYTMPTRRVRIVV